MKKLTVAIIGCGNRGCCYAGCMQRSKSASYEIVAVCDNDPAQLKRIHTVVKIDDAKDFLNVDEFFREKRADLLIIATPDRDHVSMAIKALRLGYDLLLEKPISDDRAELDELLKVHQETGRKILICHELRYGAAFRKCAEILKTGVLGKLNIIDALERPFYWHWAQAYVRGIGNRLKDSHPCILAKCSHDLDLIGWYAGSECESVSSLGDLRFFTPENAPEGAAERCVDCKHKETCPYSAKRIYIDRWHERGEPSYAWPYSKVSIDLPHTEEKLYKGITEGEYGICAFKCPVEKVDHQVVQMNFKNGVKATLKMIYSAEGGRRITFYGSLGEMTMDERTGTIEILPFGGKKTVIDNASLSLAKDGHGGGDQIMIDELYDVVCGNIDGGTDIRTSIEAHLMGICAEESRRNGGALVKVRP